ncbi:MAG TPA: S53 family peptidase [Chloroflexota bacterium]
MKVSFAKRCGAITVSVAATLLASNAALAGKQIPGAIAAEKVSPSAQPNSTAHFKCELRPFDLSKGLFCYGPDAIRKAYGIDTLIANGLTGKGHTIVIIDAFGSPTVADDLKAFDAQFGLPDPSFKQITMPGTPAFDPKNNDMVSWTGEIALDTQWAHAVAPGANIVLVAAKSDFDEDLTAALNYALDHHLGDVVSMSFGESEAFLGNPDGLDTIAAWQSAFEKARKQHVTLFASAGDWGATNPLDAEGHVFPFQNIQWPASSPLVTSVGGTNLFFGTATNADPNGRYQGEQVWNDPYGATGGGMSSLIDEPFFQLAAVGSSINKTLHKHRGIPDVAYNGGVVGGVLAVWGVGGGCCFIFGGTSAGAPQWAGIIADLNQARGRPMGFINDRLYLLGHLGVLRGLFHDITVGDNSFGGVDGYPAKPGYDLATGWGTPNFGLLGATLAEDEN